MPTRPALDHVPALTPATIDEYEAGGLPPEGTDLAAAIEARRRRALPPGWMQTFWPWRDAPRDVADLAADVSRRVESVTDGQLRARITGWRRFHGYIVADFEVAAGTARARVQASVRGIVACRWAPDGKPPAKVRQIVDLAIESAAKTDGERVIAGVGADRRAS